MSAQSTQIVTSSSNATTTAIPESHSVVAGVSSDNTQDHPGSPSIPEDESGKTNGCSVFFLSMSTDTHSDRVELSSRHQDSPQETSQEVY